MTWKLGSLDPNSRPPLPQNKGCELGVCFAKPPPGQMYWQPKSFWGPEFPNRLLMAGAITTDTYLSSPYQKYAPEKRTAPPYKATGLNGLSFV